MRPFRKLNCLFAVKMLLLDAGADATVVLVARGKDPTMEEVAKMVALNSHPVPVGESVGSVWDVQHERVLPELVDVEGGHPLLYAGGKSHLLVGPSGLGKSWIALAAALAVLAADETATVGWVDFDMSLEELVGRAKALGAARSQAERLFRLPLSGSLASAMPDFQRWGAERAPTLVVVDSVEQALVAAGVDVFDAGAVRTWWRRSLQVLGETGARSLLFLGGRGAFGAELEEPLPFVTGAAWYLRPGRGFSQFARGRGGGPVVLLVAKDRYGANAPGECAAVASFTPRVGGDLTITLHDISKSGPQ